MNKRISLVNESTLLCEVVFVLTESQREKLESGKLREKIDHIAMDMHVCWSVEINNNIAIGLIGKECGPVIDSDTMHQIEIAATNFMSAVDKLTMPEPDKTLDKRGLIKFDDDTVSKKEIEFAKEVLADWDETEDKFGTAGAIILGSTKDCPFMRIAIGDISEKTLKQMFIAFIEKYDHE